MSEHVLILGDPSDPLVPRWQELCDHAGHAVTLYLDHEQDEDTYRDLPITVLINSHVELPFLHLQSMPDTFRENLADGCLCLSNSLTDLPSGAAIEFPYVENVVGYSAIGLYNNVPVVEIAKAMQAGKQALDRASMFLETLGLRSVVVPETPSLVFARILAMLVNEATSALMEGVATAEDIDTAMKLGTNYPMGPLAWADTVGLDVILLILSHLEDQYGDERYCPMVLLTRMVGAGRLGRKTAEGFYSYHPEALTR